MLLVILLVLILLLVQVQMPGAYLTRQVGAERQMGPRDDLPEPTQHLARSRRALGNLQETLPVFLTLGVLCIMLGETGWLPVLAAWVYLLARIGHVICYMRGLTPWRSICFVIGVLANIVMAVPLVPHIWG